MVKKYTPTVLEYLEFEKSCAIMSVEAKKINREKYNITELDLIKFYGINYPGKNYPRKSTFKNKSVENFKKERFSKKEIQEQLELFKNIFDEKDDAYINIRCRSTGEYYAYNIKSVFIEDKLYNILNSERFFSKEDLMYSLNLFTNMKKLSVDNIFTLFSIAIDVDFNETKKYIGKNPRDIIKILEKTEFGKTVPTPNIIEYGYNLRLIYTFDKVYSTKAANNLAKKISKVIGERLGDYKASGQPLSTYGRIVNSINSKNDKVVKVMYLDVEKYTLRKLQDEVLPPLKEWYAENKAKTTRKVIDLSDNFTVGAKFRKNNLARIDDFFKIQEFYNYDCDGKRFMCFQIRNHAILAGMTNQEAEELMRQFNNRFIKPLRWNVIEGDTRNVERKQYYYKSETIINHLAIEPHEEELLGLKGMISKVEHRRRDNELNKQRQKAKYRDEEGLTKTEIKRRNQFVLIARMQIEGMSQRAIAEKLGYKDNSVISRKINKIYDKINYSEILEEVKLGLYDDLNVATA